MKELKSSILEQESLIDGYQKVSDTHTHTHTHTQRTYALSHNIWQSMYILKVKVIQLCKNMFISCVDK